MRHNSVVSGHSKSTRIPRVDGLSMGPPEIGASQSLLHEESYIYIYIYIYIYDSLVDLNRVARLQGSIKPLSKLLPHLFNSIA